MLGLAEEPASSSAPTAAGAGLARRTGAWDDVRAELADIVISAYTAADVRIARRGTRVGGNAPAAKLTGMGDDDQDAHAANLVGLYQRAAAASTGPRLALGIPAQPVS